MGAHRDDLDVDEMVRLYVEERHATRYIASRLQCSHQAVRYNLLKRGIQLRSSDEQRAIDKRRTIDQNRRDGTHMVTWGKW